MKSPFHILTLSLAIALAFPCSGIAAPIGKVIFQSGNAFIVGPNGSQRPANKGELIQPGERLVTGANTLAQVKMQDGSFVGIRPGSDLKFQDLRLTGADAGQSVALNSGSIRVLNLGSDGAVKPLPMTVQAGDARIVMRGADMESAVKRDTGTGVETITRLNHGVGTLSNGIDTLNLAVNGVNSATKSKIMDAPLNALPPIDVRPGVPEGGQVKSFSMEPIKVAVSRVDTFNLPTPALDSRVAPGLAVDQGLKNVIVTTFTPQASLSGGLTGLVGGQGSPVQKAIFVDPDFVPGSGKSPISLFDGTTKTVLPIDTTRSQADLNQVVKGISDLTTRFNLPGLR